MATRSAKYKDKTKAKRNPSRKARSNATPENEVTDKNPKAPIGSYNEDQTLIQMAMDLFEDSQDGSNYNRIEAEEDIRFGRLSEQWPKDIKQTREESQRPCLTINKIPSFIRQVVNDARQSKPGIVVAPVDSNADPRKSKVVAGLVRSIERNSNAGIAYDNAIDNAASCGFGFMQLSIDYANDHSFDQVIRIHPVTNPLSVHWDVTDTSMLDASDWRYCFISELLNQKRFEEDWPDAMKVSFEGDINQRESWWLSDDGVRVSTFWLKEIVEKKLLLIRDNTNPHLPPDTIYEEDFNKSDDMKKMVEAGGWSVIRERDVKVPKVMRRIITGAEVLEELEWPGPTIPVAPVWGEVVVLDGRRYLRSMIRDIKDSQIMFNYWRTTATELVALQPKTPFIGPLGFVPEGHQSKWENANTKNYAYLEFDAEATGGIAPTRQGFSDVPVAAITEAANATDDMKSITGIHDASLGAKGNETSGRAIQKRQMQSDVSNYHFIDNLNRGIQYLARCIVDGIPSVYSERETLRILGEDMKEEVVELRRTAEGKPEILYDLSIGRYDVTVKAGPSYHTQREETREVFIEMMRAMPDIAPYISDFLMDHMDFQGAEKLSKRLKLLLPPQIQQMEMQEDTKDMPPEFKEAMQQAQMIIQQQEEKLKQALSEQAPEMKKLENEQIKAVKDAEVDKAKAEVEALKIQDGIEKTKAELTLDQEANTLKGRELDLKEREVKVKEEEVDIKREELQYKQDELDFKEKEERDKPEEPEKKEEKGNGVDKDSQAIQAGLLALVKTQQAPIKVKKDKKTGELTGERVMDQPPPDKVN